MAVYPGLKHEVTLRECSSCHHEKSPSQFNHSHDVCDSCHYDDKYGREPVIATPHKKHFVTEGDAEFLYLFIMRNIEKTPHPVEIHVKGIISLAVMTKIVRNVFHLVKFHNKDHQMQYERVQKMFDNGTLK